MEVNSLAFIWQTTAGGVAGALQSGNQFKSIEPLAFIDCLACVMHLLDKRANIHGQLSPIKYLSVRRCWLTALFQSPGNRGIGIASRAPAPDPTHRWGAECLMWPLLLLLHNGSLACFVSAYHSTDFQIFMSLTFFIYCLISDGVFFLSESCSSTHIQ